MTPARVVSLVPSATETLVALGLRPVGCTRFCDLAGVPTVGGTKNVDVDAVAALAPDLVIVNDEENRLEDADALVARGCYRCLEHAYDAAVSAADHVRTFETAVLLVARPEADPVPSLRALAAGLRLPGDQ